MSSSTQNIPGTIATTCRALLCVLVGLYLVLPNCLCQTLSAFGVVADEHAQQLFDLEDSLPSFSPDSCGLEHLCQCDDPLPKVAEMVRADGRPTGIEPLQRCAFECSIVRAFPVHARDWSNRGPPDPADLVRISRPTLGVYRL